MVGGDKFDALVRVTEKLIESTCKEIKDLKERVKFLEEKLDID